MSEKAKETIVSSTEKAANGISTITGAIKQTASAKTGSKKKKKKKKKKKTTNAAATSKLIEAGNEKKRK